MNLYIVCLIHTVDHQHAAVAVSTIFSVIYKNIRKFPVYLQQTERR
jgi:hypothetical protein